MVIILPCRFCMNQRRLRPRGAKRKRGDFLLCIMHAKQYDHYHHLTGRL